MSRRRCLMITRPAEDAEPLIRALHDRGFESLLEPMLSIVAEPGPAPDLVGVQALLMTSANGVRAFANRTRDRNLPVLAVGDATAQAARDAGFARVKSAGGTVDDLARLAIGHLRPPDGALLHIAGTRVAGDLAQLLVAAGFVCRRDVLYRAETALDLTLAAIQALAAGTVDGVLFFSPRTATTFVRLMAKAGVTASAARIDAFCLSPAVAEAAGGAPWRRSLVALRPDQVSLLATIQAAVTDEFTSR